MVVPDNDGVPHIWGPSICSLIKYLRILPRGDYFPCATSFSNLFIAGTPLVPQLCGGHWTVSLPNKAGVTRNQHHLCKHFRVRVQLTYTTQISDDDCISVAMARLRLARLSSHWLLAIQAHGAEPFFGSQLASAHSALEPALAGAQHSCLGKYLEIS